jgi:ABC-type amino acid transport system permease subunit
MNHLGRALLDDQDPHVNVLFVYNNNAAVTSPHQQKILKGLEREDLFTVVFDQVMTDTARYADVLLPATTFIEGYEIARGYGPISLQLGKPVVEAAGEARSNAEVFGEPLNRLGIEFLAAVMALGVYHGARFSEVIRAGIQSIPRTQLEAALSTGLSVAQAYRYIILPIALRLIVPPLTNESLNLLKNSSLALTIGVAELTFQTRQIETYTAKAIEALTAGTLIYLVLCLSIATIMAKVERHYAIPGLISRAKAA